MAFGNGAFGGMPIGVDPPNSGPDYQRVAPPAAAYFDPLTREYLVDDEGRIRDMGTIEQQVALSFAIQRKTLQHSPDTGHDFLSIPRLDGERLEAEYVRRAALASPFADLLASGKVELVGIEQQHPKDTETRLLIKWRKTGSTELRRTPVGSG